MRDNNMLMRTTKGADRVFSFYGWQSEIDVTNPETRKFVWSKLKENYIDNGVDALWFDEAEPEIHPEDFDNLIWYKGRGDEVALLYPYYYSKMAYDGFKEIGIDDSVTLVRCAYTAVRNSVHLCGAVMYFRHLRVCPSRLKPVLICLCAVFLGGTPISADFSAVIRRVKNSES